MTLRASSLIIIGTAAVLASCTTAAPQEVDGPKVQQELAMALRGRVAGAPVQCMPNYRSATQMQVIDDNTLLFHDGGTVYVQHPPGGCRGLKNGGYTLVTRQFGANQICEGDINRLIELRTGMFGGTCVFGSFLPYRKG